jgi:membrane-bound lytic murein transglycosylase D
VIATVTTLMASYVATSTLTSLMAVYLEAGLAVALAGSLFAASVRWGGRRVLGAAARWVGFGWCLMALAVVAPLGWRAGGVGGLRPATVEVWGSHGPALSGLAALGPATSDLGTAAGIWTAANGRGGLWVGRPVALILIGLLGVGAVLALGRRCWHGLRLRALCAALPVWKARGRVRLCVSDRVGAPFAARSRGLAFIVIPTSLLVDPARLRLVIAHEAAHHRRGDLLLAPWLAVLRALFFWNPLLIPWERALRALEDLACDGRVLHRARVTPSDYGQALLWAVSVARGGAADRVALLGGRAMACESTENLRRRILMLNRPRRSGGLRNTLLGTAVAASVLLGSWAVRGAVSERRLGIFAAKKLPRVLIAVGLQESGFDNDAKTAKSAGIWQFIPSTGRAMGLIVTPARDERLEPKRATEAAAAYFEKLYQKFGDWPVAIAAYNAGEKLIEPMVAGLSKEQARRKLLESDTEFGRYLVGVMASVIVSENPTLLD